MMSENNFGKIIDDFLIVINNWLKIESVNNYNNQFDSLNNVDGRKNQIKESPLKKVKEDELNPG